MSIVEYYIAYDEESGAELYRGSGPIGTAAEQVIEGGPAIMLVPRAAITAPVTDLEPIKVALMAQINAQANDLFASLMTDISGQARRYMLKLQEARTWEQAREADQPTPYPFMAAEAAMRGMSIEAVREGILAQYAASVAVESALDAARVSHRAAVQAATTLTELGHASKVDWPAILAAAAPPPVEVAPPAPVEE